MHSKPTHKTSRKPRWSPISALALPALLLLAFDPRAAEAGPPRSKSSPNSKAKKTIEVRKSVNSIDGLSVEELDDGTTILRLRGTVEPTFNVYRLPDPDRLIVDISKSERGEAVPHVPVDSWAVGRVTISTVEEQESTLARVVVNLKREASYIVVPKGRDLVVTITPKQIAPEAYFARKSAGKRQAEIRSLREAAEAEAKAARAEVKSAKRRLAGAESKASLAEERAKSAEERAKSAATKAAKAQTEAEKIRAEAEAIKAEAEVEAAKLEEAARKRVAKLEARATAEAEKLAAEAEAEAKRLAAASEARAKKLEAEAAAAAKARAEQAEQKAKKVETAALARAKKLEAEAIAAAKAAKARAKQVEAEAKEKAEKAEAKARQAEAEAKAKQKAAEAKLARLEAEAAAKEKQAKSKAAKLEAEAAKKAEKLAAVAAKKAKQLAEAAEAEAEQLEASARKRVAKIEAEAEAHEREASTTLEEARKAAALRAERLAAAEAEAVEAERKAKQAEERAAQAKKEAEVAESYAKRVRENAEAKAKQATELLAEAKTAMSQAEEDSEQAKLAHAEAKQALSEARKAARKLGKRDESKRRELERAVAQAEAAAEAAKKREDQAQDRLAKLERDHEALEQALETKQAEADELRQELASTDKALASARGELDQAKSRFEALGGQDGPKSRRERREHRRAKAQLAKAESAFEKLQDQNADERAKLAELRDQVAEAQSQLDETLVAAKQRRSLSRQWQEEREAAEPTTIRDVRFVDGPKGSQVIVELDGPVVYDASSLTPNMTMLELRDARIARALERSLDTTSFKGPIDQITSFREGDDVKIVVASQTGESAGIELDRKANRLIWRFPRNTRKLPAKATTAPSHEQIAAAPETIPLAKQPEDAPPKRSEVVSLGGNKVSGFSTPPVLAARPGTQVGKRSRWRGERIDIELQDAPIKDVLLLFSDIGRVNIIAGPEVQGSVTMKLSAVPWDQALDIILRSLNLGMVQEGNVIRVATEASLEEERRKAIEEANARVQLKPLETRLIPLSYATVGDMLPKVQSVLSSRGSVTPDSRTNTLIVMDVAENIALAESLVRQLDSQTPQVLIEARIVEARTNWLRQLGIQWGFDFIASPGTGNPTGLLFPNSVGVAGGSGSNQSPTRGLILPGAAANPNYAVDLPAPVSTGNGGAIGFSFGSLSGNLNTNLRLSAAEDEGEVRIISAPKIVTLDNSEAQIEQGVQIPISQVSAQGVNTRYVNATLGLRVTPHVTNEGAVLLQVEVQKNEADFVNTGARGDPTILTKSARSQLLITDGDTAVIGGIYTRNQAVNHNKVPWFADIPIIGWFFKNKTERDDRSEMLIFLTPRIVNRSSSIGG